MGQLCLPRPVLRLLVAFSRHEAAIDWARSRAVETWGEIALASPKFDFSETNYYEQTMGGGLRKVIWAFESPADPAGLADWKLESGHWEEEYARLGRHDETRPLNLDPGYLTAAKLVLASTKDHAHRIYLRKGIYAEVTLFFKDGRWQPREWTFPDYRRADYHEFLIQCREHLRARERRKASE